MATIDKYWNRQALVRNKNIHPICVECMATRLVDHDIYNEDKSQIIFAKGEFAINCRGIPLDYSRILPKTMWDTLSAEEQDIFLEIYDPVYWAYKHLQWLPRVSKTKPPVPYQEMMLRCTSPRKVFRTGRRAGKSDAMAVGMLHYSSTHSGRRAELIGTDYDRGGQVTVFTPLKNQSEELFDRMASLMNRSDLASSVVHFIKNPLKLEFSAGGKIKAYTAGAGRTKDTGGISGRGTGANLLVFDELDYIDDSSVESMKPILQEHDDIELWASSTPKGRKDGPFYDYCHSPRFKEFHFSSKLSPSWNALIESEILETTPRDVFAREYLAEFGELEDGVFPQHTIDMATADYSYEECTRPQPSEIYMFGIDWNKNTATEIIVIGGHPEHGYRVVHSEQVHEITEEDTLAGKGKQTKACLKIMEMNRVWKPYAIYADSGYGSTQCELLHQIGFRARTQMSMAQTAEMRNNLLADSRLLDIVHEVDFSTRTETIDPFTYEKKMVPTKQYMVQNAVKQFEEKRIIFPAEDRVLKDQLANYIILRVSPSGMPVYGTKHPTIGDHKLDAMILALYGFVRELSIFGKIQPESGIGYVKSFGKENVSLDEPSVPDVFNRSRAGDPGDPDNRFYIKQTEESKENFSRGFLGRTRPKRTGTIDDQTQNELIHNNPMIGGMVRAGTLRGPTLKNRSKNHIIRRTF